VKLTAWDLQTGCERLAKLYEYYYNNAQAIIFVVDSTDRERIAEAAEQLVKMLEDEKLKDAALLVLANKQDREGMGI
jgi:GTPase SAR1 family protein